MNYLQKGKGGKSRVIPAIILILCLMSARIILPDFSAGIAKWIARPFWNIRSGATESLSYIPAFLQSRQNIIDDNKKNAEEINKLDLKLLRLDFLEKENAELKQALGRKDENQKATLAYVLVRPPQTFYDSLVLDVGSRENIEKGDQVILDGNVVIGEIIEVNGKTSIAKIYSSAGEKKDALVLRSNIPVAIEGMGSGIYEAKLPKESDVEKDDLLILSGAGRIVLGNVENVESSDSDSFKRILVKAPFNIFQIKSVLVQKPNI